MKFFGRNRGESTELRDAQAAQTRANEVINQVDGRSPEVNQLVNSLRQRRIENNFGDALALAMERRPL